MIRRIVLYAVMCLFFCGLAFGVVYFNNPEKFKKEPEKQVQGGSWLERERTEYEVKKGEVPVYCRTSGTVISHMPDVYEETLVLENVRPGRFETDWEKGDELAAGEVLYRLNGNEKKLDYPVRVLAVDRDKTDGGEQVSIRLLNYDKLYLTVWVNAEQAAKLTGRTETELVAGEQSRKVQILNIGYEIEGGNIPVTVSVPSGILPGSRADVKFLLEVKKNRKYVSTEALYLYGDKWYVNALRDGQLVQTQVKEGEHFLREEDGKETEYVEIDGAISEGEIAAIETIVGK